MQQKRKNSSFYRYFIGIVFTAAMLVLAPARQSAQGLGEGFFDVYLPAVVRSQVSYFEGSREQEPNNTYNTANGALVFGKEYEGWVDDTKDYFSFYLKDPADFTIQLEDAAPGAQMLLYYNSVANTPQVVNAAPYNLIKYSGAAGWYYLQLYHPIESTYAGWRYTLRAIKTHDMVPMAYVEAGDFSMGCVSENNGGVTCSSDELPLHTVNLSGYSIDKVEVTNVRYAACVTAGACTVPASTASTIRANYYGTAAYADYPVIWVNWEQANAYCVWTGKRLPTEAEWEKAARGNIGTRPYPWGDDFPDCSRLNYQNDDEKYCTFGDTSPVGSYPTGASPYGVLDMEGNVSEWVFDWYEHYYYLSSPASNPTGPASGTFKSTRGTSWQDAGFTGSYYTISERFGNRTPDDFSWNIGFRCAVGIQP